MTDHPDADIDAVSVTVKGLPQSETDRTGLTVTFAYDAPGRRIETDDPKTGTVITHYNELGQVSAVDAPAGQSVIFGYDPVTGRKITETDAAGNVTRYAYNDRDQITHIWGDSPTPVWYEYDAYGRLWKMHTYRDGENWSAADWPTDAGEGDVTTWTYDEATGLLIDKTYADGQGVSYTYETGGNLNTRTWARTVGGAPLVTTYDYDPAAGELTAIDYSDETPDIAFTYDRAGRKETVTDAVGNRTFVYDGVNLDMEIITGIYDRTIDYDYETAGDGMAGRPAGFSVGSDYLVEYGYESGRINGLNWQVGTHTGSAGYTYQDGLIHQLQYQNGPTVTYTYDPVERYKTQVKNENDSGVISQYDYTHDILGRRETVTYSGSAFLQGPSYRRFGYNDRSELIEADAYAGSDIADTGSPLSPEYRSYAYDPIGNRTTATDWDETAEASQIIDYAANELNQYDRISAGINTDLPEYDADGNLLRISADEPLMTYNGENRLTEAEYQVVIGDITGEGSVNLTDAISAIQVAAGMTPSGVTTDGDISADGQIGIEEAVYALQTVAKMRMPAETSRKLVMAYDYLGRRVQKLVYAYGSGEWQLEKEVLFVYDGWNVIEEITRVGGSDTSRFFVWGLDVSQSLQDAGGIGGLLAMVDNGNTYQYFYDANGNVSQLVNAANGDISAHYEFDPFGNIVYQSGSMADGNPFRHATQYFDEETGLIAYIFRYYDPELGRWLTRDPVEEEDSSNLYLFVQNNPTNTIDLLGLKSLIDYLEERMLYFYNNHNNQVGSQCPVQFGLEQTNCIIYCSSVIEWAYAQIGKKEIAKTIAGKSKKGTDLAKYLQSIGWKGIYWNPDVNNPSDNDNEHPYSYAIAKKKKTYYGIPISDYVINYRPTPVYSNNPPWWKVWESKELDKDKMTPKDVAGLTKLKRVRFGFGAARGGRHTFLYGSGSIYEVHWVGIGILGNLYEKSPFEDYGWLSGVLMVPPGNGVY